MAKPSRIKQKHAQKAHELMRKKDARLLAVLIYDIYKDRKEPKHASNR